MEPSGKDAGREPTGAQARRPDPARVLGELYRSAKSKVVTQEVRAGRAQVVRPWNLPSGRSKQEERRADLIERPSGDHMGEDGWEGPGQRPVNSRLQPISPDPASQAGVCAVRP